jgi:hypothetical protein
VFVRNTQCVSNTKLKLLTKQSKGKYLGFLDLLTTENKRACKVVWKVFLMAKSGSGIMVSLDPSLSRTWWG